MPVAYLHERSSDRRSANGSAKSQHEQKPWKSRLQGELQQALG
jgi:hypothetical protein